MNAPEKKLTKEQENFVWQYISLHMQEDDRNPYEVIRQDYDGDTSRYLQVMAMWHGIKFTDGARKENQ